MSVNHNGLFAPFQLVSLYQMLNTYAAVFFTIGTQFQTMADAFERVKDRPDPGRIPAGTLKKFRTTLRKMKDVCLSVDLDSCAKGIDRILDEKNLTWGSLYVGVGELHRRFEDELDSVLTLYVPSQYHAYLLRERELFGERVAAAFPSANYDIEEAASCYGLGRSTACVMHLMRVVEAGMKVLANNIGVPVDTNLSWDAILKRLDDEIPKGYKQSVWNTEEAEFYTDAARHIRTYIKARNRTQHAEKKYTPEEAKRIMDAVHDLMDHLSSRLSEPPEVQSEL